MADMNFQDRRDSVRVKRIVTVRFRLFKRNGKKVDDVWQLSTTQDMSYSGLLFASVIPFKIDDILEIQVVMSGVLDLFNGLGRVVRVVPIKGDVYHIGLKYVDLKTRSRSAKSMIETTAQSPKKRARSAKKI